MSEYCIQPLNDLVSELLYMTDTPAHLNSMRTIVYDLRLPTSPEDRFGRIHRMTGNQCIASAAAPCMGSRLQLIDTHIRSAINKDFSPRLDETPHAIQATVPEASLPGFGKHFVIVGGSHSTRLAAALSSAGCSVVDISQPAWKLTHTSAKEAARDLTTAVFGSDEETIVIAWLYDDTIYQVQDDGFSNLREPVRSEGQDHIDGRLGLFKNHMLWDHLIVSVPVLRAAGGRPLILIGPLPRFHSAKCCDSSDHVTNFRAVLKILIRKNKNYFQESKSELN